MFVRSHLFTILLLSLAMPCIARENPESEPIELQVLKASIGVWDAEIEVWPGGPDSTPIKFTGVETNRSFGEYWIASDFDSEFKGQVTKVHSIIGYDLDEGKLVGKVIDRGPYAASMTGDYDEESKTIHWTTKVKTPDGKPIVQKTSVSQRSADERVLELSIPNKKKDSFIRFMRIKFVRRK